MTQFSADWFLADVAQHCFRLHERGGGAPRIGAEIEFLPLDGGQDVVSLRGEHGSIALLDRLARRLGWREQRGEEAPPSYHSPAGGKISFEPGGQIEYSSAVHSSASALLRDLEQFAAELRTLYEDAGHQLITDGIDPFNPVERATLQLTTPRYCNMARHFASLGTAGARMMRQTTALQVNLDTGGDPLARWQLLNSLAPSLIALFANSACYEGRRSGYESYRAQVWRETDPDRTGVFGGVTAVEDYTRFALGAHAILGPRTRGYPTFAEWSERGASEEDWRAHLTTLFPEVRPKGYYEVRCIDGQPERAYAAPIALLSGLVYDDLAARAALELLPSPNEDALRDAGRNGVESRLLRPLLPDLIEIAGEGCRRLPAGFLDGADLERAAALWRERLAAAPSSAAGVSDAAPAQLRH